MTIDDDDDLTTPVDRSDDVGKLVNPPRREQEETRITAPPSDGDALAGRRFGRYRLISELGAGAQGAVYLAEDERLRRQVALKVLFGGLSHSVEARLRFEREASITGNLNDPGIAKTYEFGEDDGLLFIAMELVKGQTLAERIAEARSMRDSRSGAAVSFDGIESGGSSSSGKSSRTASSGTQDSHDERGPLSAARFMMACCRALHTAHGSSLVHRDIKPGNIMVREDGRPCILDFGLAHDDSEAGLTLTGSHDRFGTPAFMAPEQVRGMNREVDCRTDVWALGASLYQCCTLERPFEAPTLDELYQKIKHEDPRAPRALNPRVPKDLEAIILTAMDKDQDRRYATAEAMADDLRRLLSHEPVLARPAGRAIKSLRWAQRNPVIATLSSVVLVLSLTSAVVFYVKNRQLGAALAKEKAAVADRDSALAKEREALADYLRMSDVKRLRDAKTAAAALFPPHPALVARLTAWQEEYRETFEKLPSHEAALLRLREKALPYSDEDRKRDHADAYTEIARLDAELEDVEAKLEEQDIDKLEDRLSELRTTVSIRASWSFENDDLAFKHETLTQLVTDLKNETGPQGVWSDIATRLAVSKTIKARTVNAFSAAWSETIAGIAASPKYEGLRIVPQIGLIPLGSDPESGLFEFLHWLSHEEEAPLPNRDDEGRLEVKEATGMILVLLPGGEFLMGAQSADASKSNHDAGAADDEWPVHSVTLAPFLLGKYEVTQAQWLRMTGDRPSAYGPGTTFGDHATTLVHPVEQVSWLDSMSASGRVGLTLPTEAQWEYGCRAGTGTIWSCGDEKKELQEHANLADAFCQANDGPSSWQYETDLNDGRAIHAPVGTFAPNGFGLFDVHGNVWEWCRDEYDRYAPDTVQTGDGLRLGPGSRSRVNRGGSFDSPAEYARSAARDGGTPEIGYHSLGLRVARLMTE